MDKVSLNDMINYHSYFSKLEPQTEKSKELVTFLETEIHNIIMTIKRLEYKANGTR